MLKGSINKNWLVIWLFIILPFLVDQINGFAFSELNISFSFSKLYKTPLIMLAFLYVVIFDNKGYFKIALLLLLLFIMISQFINFYVNKQDFDSLTQDFGYLLKIFTFPIVYCFMAVYYSHNPLPDFNIIRKLYIGLFLSFALAIFLSYFGFGIPFYGITKEGESIGHQGYFISGNEISAFYLFIVCIFYYLMVKTEKLKYIFSAGALSICIGLIMGSKTAIISAVVCFAGVYALYKVYFRKTSLITKADIIFLVSFVGFAIICFIFIDEILDAINPVYRTFLYRYRTSQSFMDFITSGRNIRAEFELNYFASSQPLIQMIFGKGYTLYKSINVPNTKHYSAEIDFIDVMNIAGAAGVVIIYAFWIVIWFRIYKMFIHRKSEYSIPLLISVTILFLNSNISGHIIYAALLSFNLGFLALIAKKDRDILPDAMISKKSANYFLPA